MRIETFRPDHMDNIELWPSEMERFAVDPRSRDKVIALAQYGNGGRYHS
jgi:hypothetical protein